MKLNYDDVYDLYEIHKFNDDTGTGIIYKSNDVYDRDKDLIHYEKFIWYFNGKIHRIDGPAVVVFIEREHDPEFNLWYLHGKMSDFTEWLKENCIDLKDYTSEDITFINMKWSNRNEWYFTFHKDFDEPQDEAMQMYLGQSL